jgi:hypothetical protein
LISPMSYPEEASARASPRATTRAATPIVTPPWNQKIASRPRSATARADIPLLTPPLHHPLHQLSQPSRATVAGRQHSHEASHKASHRASHKASHKASHRAPGAWQKSVASAQRSALASEAIVHYLTKLRLKEDCRKELKRSSFEFVRCGIQKYNLRLQKQGLAQIPLRPKPTRQPFQDPIYHTFDTVFAHAQKHFV